MTRLLVPIVAASLVVYAGSVARGTAFGRQASTIILDVGVESADGTPVTSLTRDDFEVRVDSAPRPIESFSTDNRPLGMAMLVDVSTSMSHEKLTTTDDDRYHQTLESFILTLRPGDRALLGRVSSRSAMSRTFISDADTGFREVSDVVAVPDIDRFGPSPLWDALAAAIERLSTVTGSRALLAWTDGRSTGNRLGIAEVRDLALAHKVSLHILLEHLPQATSRSGPHPCVSVAPLTAPTGGSCLVRVSQGRPGTPISYRNLAPINEVRRVVSSLHSRYTLEFQDEARDGQMHALEVRVKRSGLRVRAPARYLAK
jgi:VWFA-related protein